MFICQICGKEWSHQDAADNEFTCTKKCGGTLNEKKDDIAKKSLFISYGRDQYAFVAERLNKDLSALGYPVWFDKNKLKEGEDWEDYIENGIRMATQDPTRGRVVFIVTPHSARKPEGYCLNELAMALMKGAKIIPVMLVESEVPLSIARIQYLDIRDCMGADGKINEEIYQRHLKRLMEAIDHDRLNYEGVQSKLIHALEPLEFSVDILFLLQNFAGRHWIINDIEQWVSGEKTSRVFWLTGSPGVGKSAISAWLRERQRAVKAFHFCLHNDEKKKSPINLVKSVAYQLATQIPAYMEKLGSMDVSGIVREYPDAGTLFKALIVEPLHKDIPAPDEPIVILIDGLDEATENKRNRIAEFIRDEFYKTPEWLKLFITSRPEEPELNSVLSSIVPYRLDGHSRANLDDLQTFLKDVLKDHLTKTADPDNIIKKIIEKSEGVFLYATWVVKDVLEKRLSLDRVDEFPIGLAGVYSRYFERIYPNVTEYQRFAQSVLGIILATYAPLKTSLIAEIAGCREIEVMNFRKALGSLFSERENGIEICHRSIADWLLNDKYSGHYSVSLADGHRAIIKKGLSQYREKKIDNYYLEFLPLHLMHNGEEEKSADLLTDFDFTMERLKARYRERVLSDYRTMGITAEKDICERMKYWTAFFREKAHILRRGDEEWPSYKILLQLAIEHADDSSLTIGAEKFLADGKCDWVWLRREQRVAHVGINPCIAVLEGHESAVKGARMLKSGKILSWSFDSSLRIWDNNGVLMRTLQGHTREINGAIEISDDKILSWSEDNILIIWQGMTGKSIHILKGHSGAVKGAFVFPNGNVLSWSSDGTMRIWECADGSCIKLFSGHLDTIYDAQLLSDDIILSVSNDSTLRTWDIKSEKNIKIYSGHSDGVIGARIISEDNILSWSHDGTLRIWNIDTGECLHVLSGHSSTVRKAYLIYDRIIVSVADGEPDYIMWDAKTGRCIQTIEDPNIGLMKWTRLLQDNRLLSWRVDSLRIFDLQTNQESLALRGHEDKVRGAEEMTDKRILSWSDDKTLRIWNNNGLCTRVFHGHSGAVTGACLLSEGFILSWSSDRSLRIWDSKIEQSISVVDGHDKEVKGTRLISDNQVLSWSYYTIKVWDIKNGCCKCVLEGHNNSIINGVAELNNGNILSWDYEGTLKIWSKEDGCCLKVLEGHQAPVRYAEKMGKGNIVSYSGDDKTIRIWDVEYGTCIHVIEDTHEPKLIMSSLIFAQCYRNEDLKIWNGLTGECLHILKGHTGMITTVLFLKENLIVSSAFDNTLRIWDLETDECLQVLKHTLQKTGGEDAWVCTVKQLPNNRLFSIATTSVRGMEEEICIWDINTGNCLYTFSGHEATILSDESILILREGGNVEVRDSHTGECIKRSTLNEFMAAYSYLLKDESGLLCGKFMDEIMDDRKGVKVGNIASENKYVWHSDSIIDARHLLSDGTEVITQADGQVCFLRLYDGAKRIAFEELI